MDAEKLIEAIRNGGRGEDNAIRLILKECQVKYHLYFKVAEKLRLADFKDCYIDAVLKLRNQIRRGRNIDNICGYIKTIFNHDIRSRNKNEGEIHSIPEDFDIMDEAASTDHLLLSKEDENVFKELRSIIGEKRYDIILMKESGYTMEEIAMHFSYKNAESAKANKNKHLKKAKSIVSKFPELLEKVAAIMKK